MFDRFPVSAAVLPGAIHVPSMLVVVILLAALGTGLLFLASLVAYWRRRSRPFLLVSIALGALSIRPLVGLGTVLGVVNLTHHHLVEHVLDFLIALLILVAVVRSAGESDVTGDSQE